MSCEDGTDGDFCSGKGGGGKGGDAGTGGKEASFGLMPSIDFDMRGMGGLV